MKQPYHERVGETIMKITMIRHFATAGNLAKRYIGRTDEPLCEEGEALLRQLSYPKVEAVFASPMKRCVKTANLIYPELSPTLCSGLRECDFGTFENKNYLELKDNKNYQLWIDSNGLLPFPEGENLTAFKKRTIKSFKKVITQSRDSGYKSIALVVHGGTIMSILEHYSFPRKDYYHWQVKNGFYYTMDYEKGRLIHICGIH